MLTLQGLESYLAGNHCDFELLAHPTPIRSVQDAGQYFELHKSAPTLILQADKDLLACIVSSQRGRIDLKALKQELGCSRLKMAEKNLVQELTGYPAGAIPLIGHGLSCIFDHRLLAFDYIYGGSGDELHTLKIAPADVIRMNNVIGYME